MTTERIIRGVAGAFVLLSLSLGYFVSPYWLLFTGFVGLNLFQSAFTRWCPLEVILVRLGFSSNSISGRSLTVKNEIFDHSL
jgi:EamA domain-containing membrane protein RarD